MPLKLTVGGLPRQRMARAESAGEHQGQSGRAGPILASGWTALTVGEFWQILQAMAENCISPA